MKKLILLLPLLATLFACGSKENENVYTNLRTSYGEMDTMDTRDFQSSYTLSGPNELGIYEIRDSSDAFNIMYDVTPDGKTTMVNTRVKGFPPNEWRSKHGHFLLRTEKKDTLILYLYDSEELKRGAFLMYTR